MPKQTRVFYMSDLHLDCLWSFFGSSIHPKLFDMLPTQNTTSDILLICGDVANNDTKVLSYAGESWLKVVSGMFRDIVMTHGNHSFYLTEFDNMEAKFDKLLAEQDITNVHVLRDSSWLDAVTGVLFVGGTLWSSFDSQNPLSMVDAYIMNDYKYIRNKHYSKITPQDTLAKHLATVKYLKTMLQRNKDKNTVVVTHHLPSFQLITEQYRGEALNGCYASSLDGMIIDNSQISHWIAGHTHISNNLYIGDTRCVINPFGYSGENKQFNRNAYFVVDNL